MESSMVSVMIPSCKEQFLQKTIDCILEKATGEIEVIAGLDGCDQEVREDPRVSVVKFGERTGMRPLIRAMADKAKGEYILKCDAHCQFAEGFDEELARSCEDNWIVVPRQYHLNDETWDRDLTRGAKSYADYWYLTPPAVLEDHEKGAQNLGLKGRRWYKNLNDPSLDDVKIDDTMTFQGSCWLMKKSHFDSLKMQDEGFGTFGYEAAEIGTKTWQMGGRVVVNKNTWFAHLHKGKKYHRGYFLSKGTLKKSGFYFIDVCMNDKWADAKYTMREFVELFGDVPGWSVFDWSREW